MLQRSVRASITCVLIFLFGGCGKKTDTGTAKKTTKGVSSEQIVNAAVGSAQTLVNPTILQIYDDKAGHGDFEVTLKKVPKDTPVTWVYKDEFTITFKKTPPCKEAPDASGGLSFTSHNKTFTCTMASDAYLEKYTIASPPARKSTGPTVHIKTSSGDHCEGCIIDN